MTQNQSNLGCAIAAIIWIIISSYMVVYREFDLRNPFHILHVLVDVVLILWIIFSFGITYLKGNEK